MGIFSKNRVPKDDLVLQVKIRKRPRFKAGAELSSAVNLTVEVNETEERDSNVMELKLHLYSKRLLKIK
ncbi:hypothetical protein [Fluviicola taffensis]|uniref:Uncharacterized protein n=1 Tax=Fluviicola taffensis (strain DSM 16823 / NCIMB 13979 / RW262) TaxID=755732 RepID=F2IJV7_FLUTR|nr:hypothetical protein [Fluviicola taffensis]AEA45016.1 hypothetical protein Fluta_3039 [Fluviicola taffensis DSM 16823]